MCYSLTHVNCQQLSQEAQNLIRAKNAVPWICEHCTIATLPFHSQNSLNVSHDTINSDLEEEKRDNHFQILRKHKNSLKILHLNARSLVSSIDKFRVLVNTYSFDIYTISETWLSNNQMLIDHVQIPQFKLSFKNRETKRVGGVAAYLREDIKAKRRDDIFNFDPTLEHLW